MQTVNMLYIYLFYLCPYVVCVYVRVYAHIHLFIAALPIFRKDCESLGTI